MLARVLLVAALALGLAIACSSSRDDGGRDGGGGGTGMARICVPGSTQACVGPGACQGGQACRSDGSGWGACDCGQPGRATGSGGSGTSTTDGRGTATGGASGTGGTGGEAVVKLCFHKCNSPSDCGTGVAYDDADNYRCEKGVCRYTGCNNQQECASLMTGLVCAIDGLTGTPACVKSCSAPADCALPSPAYDADNWRCEGGGCRYTGCKSETECDESFPNMKTACVPFPSGTRACLSRCMTAADCTLNTPAYDADNYRCDDGICTYTGCRNDTECDASIKNTICVVP